MRSLMADVRRPKRPMPERSTPLSSPRRGARPGIVEGGVADTLDGRFAVLASLAALAILRLEDGDEDAVRHSVALTESFIADMDAQMREIGFGDPSIGKQVRFMVGALASRVDRWRRARGGRARMERCRTLQHLPRRAARIEAARRPICARRCGVSTRARRRQRRGR